MNLKMDSMAGLVTTDGWCVAPDGDDYKSFWCGNWSIITDKQVPVEGFRSTEKWQLIGVVGTHVVTVIPGCQVKFWCQCNEPPAKKRGFYVFE